MGIIGKITKEIKGNKNELFLILIILLATFLVYGLIRLVQISDSRPNVKIDGINSNLLNDSNLEQTGLVVGSKKGSKYHFPWCAGATQIKESNKIWFSSRVDAELAGYQPAKNCPGL